MKFATLQNQVRARLLIQKADQLARVDAGVKRVGAIAVRWYAEQLRPLVGWARGRDQVHVARRVAEVLGEYWSQVDEALEDLLADHVRWSWDQGFQVFVDTLPRVYWLYLANLRGVPVREAVDYSGAGELQVVQDLFRPPTLPEVRRLMFKPPAQAPDGLSWRERIDRYSRLTTAPYEVADKIRNGLMKGRNPNDVAEGLLDFVQGNQAAATRIARGEMLRIGQDGLREQWSQFDDVIDGYEIRATFDERTRPHHRTRHGDLYLNPKPDGSLPEGAKGTPDERPMVPDEFNCRCYESPVLKELPGVFEDVVKGERTVATVDGNQDDPVTMSRWFDGQEPGRKKRILGPRRYHEIEKNLGRAGYGQNVTWADSVDVKTGKFVPVRELAGEPIPSTVARRMGNTIAFEKRAAALTAERPELFPGVKLGAVAPPLPPEPPPGPTDPPPPPGPPPAGLTRAQAQALEDWQNGGHVRTRDYYRETGNKAWTHTTSKAEVGREIRKIDRGLAKLPKATTPKGQAKTLFRGLKDVRDEDLHRLLQADVLDFDNYQAATRSKKTAEAFANGAAGSDNVLLRMKSANGRDLSVLGGRAAREKTVLFERGRRWKVVKRASRVTDAGGRLHELWLEELPPSKDSPLGTGGVAPRRRLWKPPQVKVPPKPKLTKPAFDVDPEVAIANAKRELRELGLTPAELKTGQVGGRPAHEVFWQRLREANGTHETKAGVRGGIMGQRKKILAAHDRAIKRIEKEVRTIEAILPDRGTAAWDELAKTTPYTPVYSASPAQLEYKGLLKREKWLRRLRVKREAQAYWFEQFAEVADESLVQDPLLGEVQWKIGSRQRVAAYQWQNEIKCWRVAEEDLSTYAHEFGHHVEYRNQRVQDRLVRWRRERSGGLPMKSVYPGNASSNEVGWPDPWYVGYCGRVYAGRNSTEILSMGMQFTTSAEELADVAGKDFDHVAMIWAILRGY